MLMPLLLLKQRGVQERTRATDLRDGRNWNWNRALFSMGSFIVAWISLTRRSATMSSTLLGRFVGAAFTGAGNPLLPVRRWSRGSESNMPTDYPHRDNLTAKRICELAREGDEFARQAVDREAHYLGLGLANLVTLFTPDAIVLGGSVMKSAALFSGRDSQNHVPLLPSRSVRKDGIDSGFPRRGRKSDRRRPGVASPVCTRGRTSCLKISQSSKANIFGTFFISPRLWRTLSPA